MEQNYVENYENQSVQRCYILRIMKDGVNENEKRSLQSRVCVSNEHKN